MNYGQSKMLLRAVVSRDSIKGICIEHENNLNCIKQKKITYQSLWDADKPGLRGKFITLNTILEKGKEFKSISFHLKKLENRSAN